MAKKILITGGNGFIASNFIKLIYNQYDDIEIVNLDILDFPITKNNHKDLSTDRYHFNKGSILNRSLVEKLFKKYKFDQVINFAAKSHVDNSIKDPGIFLTTNIIGTQNLLDMSLKYEVPLFIHISTDEVYGSLEYDSPSTTESANLLPNNPYSASKAGADCLVRSYHKTFGLPVIITRSSNNFGPYQYPEKLIPVIISRAIANQSVPIYGQGQNMRDWIFVADNCRAIDLVRNKGKMGEIYNIPGHKEIKNIDLAKLLLQLMNKNDSLIEYVKDRPGHDLRYSMDPSKITALGFNNPAGFEDNLKKTIEWYLENKKWLKIYQQ